MGDQNLFSLVIYLSVAQVNGKIGMLAKRWHHAAYDTTRRDTNPSYLCMLVALSYIIFVINHVHVKD